MWIILGRKEISNRAGRIWSAYSPPFVLTTFFQIRGPSTVANYNFIGRGKRKRKESEKARTMQAYLIFLFYYWSYPHSHLCLAMLASAHRCLVCRNLPPCCKYKDWTKNCMRRGSTRLDFVVSYRFIDAPAPARPHGHSILWIILARIYKSMQSMQWRCKYA
jgi:hypothetical protein